LGEDVYDQSTGRSIPSKINEIIFKPGNQHLRFEFEMIFNEMVPKKVEKHIKCNMQEDVLLLDFYCLCSYLRDCLQLINKFIFVSCKQETQFRRLTDPEGGRKIEPGLASKRIQSQSIYQKAEIELITSKGISGVVLVNDEDAKNELELKELDNKLQAILSVFGLLPFKEKCEGPLKLDT